MATVRCVHEHGHFPPLSGRMLAREGLVFGPPVPVGRLLDKPDPACENLGRMTEIEATTEQIDQWITRLRQGDKSARECLLRCAGERLLRLTRKMLRQSADVKRWEQTDDVFQNAMMRLYKSLDQIELQNASHFYHVAAMQIRRELIDLARRYQGPRGMGRHLQTLAGADRDGELGGQRFEA